MPEIIGLIPARAGSKRVPGKNVRPFGGHPLIAYTIAAARDSGVFSRVIVSTDSPDVAELCRHYGAEVPFLRPAEYAGDKSPDIEWIQYTLRRLRDEGSRADAFSILRPTSPFRLPATIQRAWAKFLSVPRADSLRAVELCLQHPGKMWTLDGELMRPLLDDGGVNPPWHSTPYQALPVVYTQNASLEMAWARVPVELGTIAGRNVVPFLTEGHEGFDINKPNDWLLAELLLARGEATLPAVATAPWPSAPATA
jgi:CMP-N,N'-diacetyllegionaminic acid synthase